MLFIDILLFFLYEVDSYESTSRIYETLTSLRKLSSLITLPGHPPFFFMYKCLFQVLGLILPLTAFQCALLYHLNVALSQLHPNSWAIVMAFEILCPFFNIQPSVSVLFFFQRKLFGKIG